MTCTCPDRHWCSLRSSQRHLLKFEQPACICCRSVCRCLPRFHRIPCRLLVSRLLFIFPSFSIKASALIQSKDRIALSMCSSTAWLIAQSSLGRCLVCLCIFRRFLWCSALRVLLELSQIFARMTLSM